MYVLSKPFNTGNKNNSLLLNINHIINIIKFKVATNVMIPETNKLKENNL